MALVLVMRLPLVALGNSGTDEEVALFSAAQRFGDAAWLLATTAGVALLPGRGLPRAVRTSARPQAPAAGAARHRRRRGGAGAGGQPLAEPAMRLIFGSDFASGEEVLQIILAGLPAYVVLGISWYAIVAFDGEPRLLRVGLAGLAVSVAAPGCSSRAARTARAGPMSCRFYAMAALSLWALARQLRMRDAGRHPAAGLRAGLTRYGLDAGLPLASPALSGAPRTVAPGAGGAFRVPTWTWLPPAAVAALADRR